jgi:hypothetical protein
MAFTTIDNFRNEVKGIARSTLFSVSVIFPNFDTNNFSFTCKAASIPASTFGKIEVPYMGRKIQFVGDRTYQDWNTTVIVDSEWKSYRNIYDWHQKMNDPRFNIAEFGNSYNMNEYKGTATITAYDQAGQPKLRVKLDGFFPYDMQELQMDWSNTDATADLTVVWAYDFSEIEAL